MRSPGWTSRRSSASGGTCTLPSSSSVASIKTRSSSMRRTPRGRWRRPRGQRQDLSGASCTLAERNARLSPRACGGRLKELIASDPAEVAPAATQQVLYRKWRPRRFGDVYGQTPITRTLRNAVAGGTPSHAYLFSGPRGTGKTTTGRILAKAVNCAAPMEGEPDEACPSCLSYNAGRALDLIELDAASNRGIDEIRDLREGTGYAPSSGRFKVYLIDEVHMLTDAAFNALLKTLEEPPPHVIFILATTEPHKIPATITSRCQRFDFRRITLSATVERVEEIGAGEGFELEAGGYELVAREATGSLRDAINLLDQLVAYHGRSLTLDDIRSGLGLVVDSRAYEMARAAVTRDLRAGLEALNAARDDGIEIRAFVREVVSALRLALLLKAGAGEELPLSDAQAEELRTLAAGAQVADIVAALRALGEVDFAGDAYDSLPAEIAFASLATGAVPASATPASVPAAPQAAAATPARPAPPRAERPAPARAPAREAPRTEAPRRPAASEVPAAPQAEAPRAASAAPPPAEPTPTPPAPFALPDGGEVSDDLRMLREQWDAVRTAARKIDFKAGALLNTGFVKSVQDDRVVVGFRFENHVDMVRDAEGGRVRQAIEQALSEATGRQFTVEPVHWEELQQAGPSPARQSSGGHMVEEAQRLGAVPLDE
ncbi:MAG: DNA polymerase III subunit gamma/tau [Dehalococcoidia bacterium]|nr:DNA polymerase III subunit gamma/tau [Dehalococcoidia bacterium]